VLAPYRHVHIIINQFPAKAYGKDSTAAATIKSSIQASNVKTKDKSEV
jgi:hypothetical protein